MNREQTKKKWAEIVVKAWSDEKFKKELIENPKKVLQEYGIDNGNDFQVLEDTKKKHYLILPERPDGELSEIELKKIAAAGLESSLITGGPLPPGFLLPGE